MLRLKLQYFAPLMWRVGSLEKTLMIRGIRGRRRRGWQRMRWLDGITDSMHMSLGELRWVGDGQGGLACCDSWGRKESGDWATGLNWTEAQCAQTSETSKGNVWWESFLLSWTEKYSRQLYTRAEGSSSRITVNVSVLLCFQVWNLVKSDLYILTRWVWGEGNVFRLYITCLIVLKRI